MPSKNQKNKNKKSPKSASNSTLTPRYVGPMTLPGTRDQSQITKIRMTYASALQSNGSGTLAGLITNNPATLGWTDWSTISPQYETFRVLSMRVRFVPIQHYWPQFPIATSSIVPGVIVTSIRRLSGSATVSSTYPQEWDYGSSVAHSMDQEFVVDWRATGAGEFIWAATSTGGQTGNVGYYADSLSVTSNYYRYFIDAIVEFQGRM